MTPTGPTEPTQAVALRALARKVREKQFDDDAPPTQRGRSRTPLSVTERLTRQTARAPARTTQPEAETLAIVKAADADPVVALDSVGKAGVPIAATPEASIASAASQPTRSSGTRPSLARQRDAGAAGGAGSRGAVAEDDRFYFGAARAKTAPATAPAAPADNPEPLLTLVLALHGPLVTTAPTSSPVAGRPLTTTQPDAP